MTTVDPNAATTGTSATTGTAVAGTVSMSAVDLDVSSGHGRTYWVLADVWNIVRRGLTHYRRQPVNIAGVIVQFGSTVDVIGLHA